MMLDRHSTAGGVGPLALVGVGVGAGVDEVPLQLATARPRKTAAITGNESASRPALFRAI
mgnify:CR=1 FL=1